MKAPRRILLPLLGAAVVAACSNSSSTGPNSGTLTSAQAQAMAAVLAQMTQNVGSMASDSAGLSAAPPLASAAPATTISVSKQVTFSAPCALGGTVAVNASVNATVNLTDTTVDATFGLVQTPSSCVVQDQASGTQFTLNGDPNVTANFQMHLAAQNPIQLSGTLTGGVDWSSGSASGTCGLDLTYTGSIDQTTQATTATITGTVCKVSVSTTVTSS